MNSWNNFQFCLVTHNYIFFEQAPGLFLLPIGMIKGINKVNSASNSELISLLNINRGKQRIVKAKYSDPTKTMSRKDAKQFEILRNEEK